MLGNVSSLDPRCRSTGLPRRLLAKALWQDFGQVDFGVRRFRLRGGPARGVLEHSAESFLTGFNAAVLWPADDRLTNAIDQLDVSFHGFAYEGAGMACGLLDLVGWAGGRHVRGLLAGPALNYPHLVHVGVGWAFARMRLRPTQRVSVALDPMLRWLAWDGYGFHQGFFRTNRVVGAKSVERGLTTDQRAIRDQGLGRSLWFHECADPEGIALRIGEFTAERQGDLWSGIGLAASYAGGAQPSELWSLVDLAGDHRADLAQGCSFGCAARQVSGTVPSHTQSAAAILAGAAPEVAARWAAQSLAALGSTAHTSEHYQRWRAGIRGLWSDHEAGQLA